MSGSIKLKHASGNGVIISAPSSNPAADRTLTLPSDADGVIAKTDSSGNLTVAGDLNTSNINGGQISNRNLIINGAMNVHQRGDASYTLNSSNTNNFIVDRFRVFSAAGTIVASQDTTVPDGQGFAKSIKLDCTVADASTEAEGYIEYRPEAQNFYHLAYGTSGAKTITVSFWVKSSLAATYGFYYYIPDAGPRIYQTIFTISSANTWEKKTITIAGDTGGSGFNNDTGVGAEIRIYFNGTSGQRGSSNQNSWGTNSSNRLPTGTNLLSSTSNDFFFTGFQIEVGSQATNYEFCSFAKELSYCQRYFQTSFTSNPSTTNTDNSGLVLFGGGRTGDSTSFLGGSYVQLSPAMRSAPTVTTFDVATPRNTNKCHRHTYGFTGSNDQPVTLTDVNINSFVVRSDSGNSANGIIYHWKCEAEL